MQHYPKKTGVALLTSDKVDLRAKKKKNARDTEENHLMIKRSIHQEGGAILNMQAVSIRNGK